MQTATYMKVNGKMIKQTEKDSLLMLTMPSMMATGLMILSMDMEKKCGTMAQPDIRVNFSRERRTAMVALTGKTVVTMRVNSLMETLKASVTIILQTLTKLILENSEEVIWKVEVWKHGQTVVVMRVTLRMGRRMEKALLNGPTATNILEVGGTESNMALGFGYQFRMPVLAEKLQRGKVNGLTASANDGSPQLKFFTALLQVKRQMQAQQEDEKINI